ncbi:MAG: response regulator [Verrucomicrobia bacterium]|nr:response regulator [Verrucomicrobiota bacterium]
MPEPPALSKPSEIRVLVASDDEIAYSVLKSQLEPEGYLLTQTDNADLVFDLIQDKKIKIIIADDKIVEASGLDLLRKVQEYHPSVVRLLFRGRTPVSALADAVKSGTIFRFVPKPWFKDDLLITLSDAIRFTRLISENKSLHDNNIQLNLKLSGAAQPSTRNRLPAQHGKEPSESDLDQSNRFSENGRSTDLPTAANPAMRAFTKMLHTFHPNIGNVSVRTVALCQTLSEILKLEPEDARSLIWAAALHDVGLIQVDRELVRRWIRGPDKCEEKDIALIQKHPGEAQNILKGFDFLGGAAEIIRSHHEYWDGSGYPDGLKEDMIPWLSRLLCVATEYCTKHGPSILAMAEIEQEAGIKFDPDTINALSKAAHLTVMPRGEREILLIELKKEMVLARDVFNANGFLLLPRGSPITDASISKLWSVNRVAPIDPFLLVYT